MSQPLVSVHIIIYNMIDFIEETLRSSLEQDYDNLEVIASDDGSTDGTQDIIREFAARYPGRLVPLIGNTNIGHTGNSNRGLAACKGKYIAFQGGDDVFLPGKIKAQVEWMEADERRVLCAHDYEAFDSATGNRLFLGSEHTPLTTGRGASHIVRNGTVWGGLTVMVRAAAVPAHGFDKHIPIVSDWIMWIDCLASGGEYGYVPGVLARYRRHERNISKSGMQILQDDQFATLAVTESRNPHLLGDVRVGRARLYRSAGMKHMRAGDARQARRFWRHSLWQHLHWKGVAALGLTYLPRKLAQTLLTRIKPPYTM